MKFIATILLILMMLSHATCGVLLWRRRNETGDYSRYIQAVLSWASAFFTMTFIFRTWAETTTADGAFFEPEHTFVPIIFQMTYFLYPLEVIRPTVGRTKVYAILFAPLLLLVSVGLCAGIEYTPLYTYADVWNHIGEFNVLLRLFALVMMLLYCFSLLLVPYDWKQSCADKKFILSYALGFCLIGLLHFIIQITHMYQFVLLHQIAWFGFFMLVAYYELKERLLVPHTAAEQEIAEAPQSSDDKLWAHILLSLDMNDKWRSPELSLTSFAEQLGSNRTYVGDAFKRNTKMTFVEYITHRRIDYVVETLKSKPDVNIHELFNYVGYRQRSTAWRNFQKVTGMTPHEFLERIK